LESDLHIIFGPLLEQLHTAESGSGNTVPELWQCRGTENGAHKYLQSAFVKSGKRVSWPMY
jgi:hypothetical protein